MDSLRYCRAWRRRRSSPSGKAVRHPVLETHHAPEEIDARELGDLIGIRDHVAQLEVGAEADGVGKAGEPVLEGGDQAVVGANVVDDEDIAVGPTHAV